MAAAFLIMSGNELKDHCEENPIIVSPDGSDKGVEVTAGSQMFHLEGTGSPQLVNASNTFDCRRIFGARTAATMRNREKRMRRYCDVEHSESSISLEAAKSTSLADSTPNSKQEPSFELDCAGVQISRICNSWHNKSLAVIKKRRTWNQLAVDSELPIETEIDFLKNAVVPALRFDVEEGEIDRAAGTTADEASAQLSRTIHPDVLHEEQVGALNTSVNTEFADQPEEGYVAAPLNSNLDTGPQVNESGAYDAPERKSSGFKNHQVVDSASANRTSGLRVCLKRIAQHALSLFDEDVEKEVVYLQWTLQTRLGDRFPSCLKPISEPAMRNRPTRTLRYIEDGAQFCLDPFVWSSRRSIPAAGLPNMSLITEKDLASSRLALETPEFVWNGRIETPEDLGDSFRDTQAFRQRGLPPLRLRFCRICGRDSCYARFKGACRWLRCAKCYLTGHSTPRCRYFNTSAWDARYLHFSSRIKKFPSPLTGFEVCAACGSRGHYMCRSLAPVVEHQLSEFQREDIRCDEGAGKLDYNMSGQSLKNAHDEEDLMESSPTSSPEASGSSALEEAPHPHSPSELQHLFRETEGTFRMATRSEVMQDLEEKFGSVRYIPPIRWDEAYQGPSAENLYENCYVSSTRTLNPAPPPRNLASPTFTDRRVDDCYISGSSAEIEGCLWPPHKDTAVPPPPPPPLPVGNPPPMPPIPNPVFID